MSEKSCSRVLKEWIERVSDPNRDPWPKLQESDDYFLAEELSNDAIVTDPTAQFRENKVTENCGFTYKGSRDEDGRFHHGGTVYFDNGDCIMCDFDHGVRNGDAVVLSRRNGIARLCGNYVEGEMNGRGKLITTNTSVTEGFFVNGVLHGLARKVDMKKFREFRRQLSFIGRYRNGRAFGPCWLYKEGGGFLYGIPDENGKFTGDKLAYVYPDLETALIGRFKDGILISGVAARISSCEIVNDVMTARFSIITKGDEVSYCKSTRTSMGAQLLTPDPYEAKFVRCGMSGVGEDSGEGLFAARDIPKDTVVAFYNGVRIPFALGGPKEDWSTSGYKIFVNADFTSGERMDIPQEFVSRENYTATLGHKVNHSFVPNCFEWFLDHPRFGVIPCHKTKRDLKKGEELFLDYEYDPYNCPAWFELALRRFAETSDEEKLEKLNRRYHKFVELECGIYLS